MLRGSNCDVPTLPFPDQRVVTSTHTRIHIHNAHTHARTRTRAAGHARAVVTVGGGARRPRVRAESAPARHTDSARALGDSPLAAVQGEIDNLIDHSAEVPVAPAVAALAPMARWRGDDDGAEEAAEEAIEALPEPVPFVAAPDPEYIDPVASWRGGRVPARNPELDEKPAPTSGLADETAEADPLPDTLFQPLPAKRSWRREASTPVPAQSWKQGGPGAERLYVPIAPQPATIEPSHRFNFGSK